MAAINFGTKSEQRDKAKSLDQAMSILQKWAGPIYEQAAKRGFGSTKHTNDPSKTAQLMANVPSEGDIWLGAVQGAISGWQAGGSAAIGASGGKALGPDGKGSNFLKIGQLLGAGAGGFLGASTMGGGRESGYQAQGALATIAENAKVWEQSGRSKLAQDAIATMGQRMLELNTIPSGPGAAQKALENAQAKDRLVADTAEQLFAAGIAPDKALQLSTAIASVHDPAGRFADIGTRAHAIRTQWLANPNKDNPQVKAQFMADMNALAQEQRIAEGHMPYNMRQFQNQVTQMKRGQQQQGGMSEMQNAMGVANGITQNFQQGAQAAAGGPPLPASVPDALRPSIAPKEKGVIDDIVPDFGPQPGQIQPTVGVLTGVEKIRGSKIPEALAKTEAQTSQALQGTLSQIRAMGANTPEGIDVVRNTEQAVMAVDRMMAEVVSGRMPTGPGANFGQKVYEDGINMGAPTAAAVGIGGAFLGGPSGAAAGGYIGYNMGKDVNVFQGRSPYLTDEEVSALNNIQVQAENMKPAWARAGDPGSAVREFEAAGIMNLLPDPAYSPKEQLEKLVALKQALLDKANANLMALQAQQTGMINKQQMDWQEYVQKEQYKAQQSISKQGSGGIYWDTPSQPF